jgi:hypothetical protein
MFPKNKKNCLVARENMAGHCLLSESHHHTIMRV